MRSTRPALATRAGAGPGPASISSVARRSEPRRSRAGRARTVMGSPGAARGAAAAIARARALVLLWRRGGIVPLHGEVGHLGPRPRGAGHAPLDRPPVHV